MPRTRPGTRSAEPLETLLRTVRRVGNETFVDTPAGPRRIGLATEAAGSAMVHVDVPGAVELFNAAFAPEIRLAAPPPEVRIAIFARGADGLLEWRSYPPGYSAKAPLEMEADRRLVDLWCLLALADRSGRAERRRDDLRSLRRLLADLDRGQSVLSRLGHAEHLRFLPNEWIQHVLLPAVEQDGPLASIRGNLGCLPEALELDRQSGQWAAQIADEAGKLEVHRLVLAAGPPPSSEGSPLLPVARRYLWGPGRTPSGWVRADIERAIAELERQVDSDDVEHLPGEARGATPAKARRDVIHGLSAAPPDGLGLPAMAVALVGVAFGLREPSSLDVLRSWAHDELRRARSPRRPSKPSGSQG